MLRVRHNFPATAHCKQRPCAETKDELASYARRATIEILASLDYCKELKYSSLAGKTVFDTAPDTPAPRTCAPLRISALHHPHEPHAFPPPGLVAWLRCWQRRELARRLALADTEACDG